LLRTHQGAEFIGQTPTSQRLLTYAQAIIDAAAFGFKVRKAQLDPRLYLICGMALKSLLEQGASPAMATGRALDEGATMKLGGRQHPIMMT
jgi:hypothetical protein